MSSDGGYTWYLSSYSLLLRFRPLVDLQVTDRRKDMCTQAWRQRRKCPIQHWWGRTWRMGPHSGHFEGPHLPSWILVIFLCTNLNLLFVSLEWKCFVPALLSCFYWWGVNASVLNIVGDRLNLYTHKHTLQLWAAEQAAYIDTLSHIKLNLLAKCCLFSHSADTQQH